MQNTAEEGLAYERDGDERMDRLERVGKPVIAQIEGYAVGAGFKIAAACDIRIATPRARRAHPRQLAVHGGLLHPRRPLGPEPHQGDDLHRTPALGRGGARGWLRPRGRSPRAIAARVRALAEAISSHAPITLRVTKDAVRRIQAERRARGGQHLIALTYTSADFKEGVRAFLAKRAPRWTGR
jgi:enoyl-CoA hydratase